MAVSRRRARALLFASIALSLPVSADKPVRPLARDAGRPTTLDWDAVARAANEPTMGTIFAILKRHRLPAVTIGCQFNPDPRSIPLTRPTQWRPAQSWWLAGYGLDARSPLRIASVGKPLVAILYENEPTLRALHDRPFHELWRQKVDPKLPAPRDPRVLRITVRHLLDHSSGFDNKHIGYDPAFSGRMVEALVAEIASSQTLASDPGTRNSYSNFGFMILARLCEGVSGKPHAEMLRALLPPSAAIYTASDTVPIPDDASPPPGSAEPATYFVQAPDREFTLAHGYVVVNAATLSWIGTQYWIAGPDVGKSFASKPPIPGSNKFWISNGSMPGSQAILVQYVSTTGKAAALCMLMNTRDPSDATCLKELNDAAADFLRVHFQHQ